MARQTILAGVNADHASYPLLAFSFLDPDLVPPAGVGEDAADAFGLVAFGRNVVRPDERGAVAVEA